MMRAYFISRVMTADLHRAFDDPASPLERVMLNARDGMGPMQRNGIDGPQMGVGDDGRVWLLSRYGPSYVDSAQLARSSPPVVIRSLQAGGQSFRDPAALVLPPGTRALDIAYTALGYAYPERARFRYRLTGVDEAWVQAGDRRQASYSNLGPGRYRFELAASNDESTWSRTGATLAIEIRPTFFESWPFKALCAAAAIGLLWLAYSVRLRVVAQRIRMRMAERMAERERIARELHDTLLQGLQGLMLRIEAATRRIQDPEPARMMKDALDRADVVLAESRERIGVLREAPPSTCELPDTLEELGRDLASKAAVPVDMSVHGTVRDLDGTVNAEIFLVAREAISNAIRHSGCRRLTIELRYEGAALRLVVRDDGVGIAEEVLRSGRVGHFGLTGMRERATRMRSTLHIRKLPAGGTEVELRVPASLAYSRP